MFKKIVVLIMAVAIILGITACSSKTPQGNNPQTSTPGSSAAPVKNTINIAIGSDPGTLDPLGASANDAWGQISLQIYDQLFTYDQSMKEIPMLAKSWDKPDELTYIFHLREGVKYSSGTEFKASDVLFSLNLNKNDPTGSLLVAKIDWDNTKVIDDNTIQIAYVEPNAPSFPQLAYLRIVSEKEYNASPDKMLTTPVGTGPYMLSKWVTGSSITLVANPNYWGEKPQIETVNYKIITDASQRTNALLAGDVDLALDIAPSDVEIINKDKNYTTAINSSNANETIIFNTTSNSVCQDVNVRKAIAYAINKEGIRKVAYSGLGNLAISPLPSFFLDYDKSWNADGYLDYNIEKAKEAIKNAGIPEGTKLKIINRGIAVHLAVSQVIQANLKEIGLDVEIVSYDPSVYTMNAMNPAGGWDMAMYSMGCPSFLTADCYNAFLLNLAIGGYKADDFVATINKALAETDLTKMAPYSKQLNEIILRDVPMFAYMETPIINAFNNSLNGYTLGYINNIPVRLLSF